jgi:hypothetical protein
VADAIKQDDGVIPGVMTLGIVGKRIYLLDGQHRREAFLLSGCEEGYVDIRVHYFEDMAAMGEEYVNLNSQLVRMRPDDILRGLEGAFSALSLLRQECPFVGYDQIRRGTNAPLLGMSAVLRCWSASAKEVPTAGGESAMSVARETSEEDIRRLAGFLQIALAAWGRDHENFRLWGNLSLTITMWLYRRLVLEVPAQSRVKRISPELFRKALMSLSADSGYVDWLVGRNLNDRDRSPCYVRIKNVVVKRIEQETGKKPMLPSPAWAAH